jgi:cytochrome bd ubiquinol oxidase subunit II
MDLVIVWTALVGVVIIAYVVLDGFSLGIGLLFPLGSDETSRDVMMNSIAPVWDANQTWLVFGGGALFAAFPTTYAVLFSALYIPLISLILGLIFRGVAFEFRVNATTSKRMWNRSFFIGSLIAVLAQGFTLGGYITGIRTSNAVFSGGAFDWLSPFSVMVALGMVTGYALLGSTYLIMKTTGEIQRKANLMALKAAWMLGLFLIAVTVWTPLQEIQVFERWTSPPRVYFLWVFPIVGLFCYVSLIRSIKKRAERLPFWYAIGVFLSSYVGLQAAVFPYAVLPDITIYQAAGQPKTLGFTLVGVAITLPVILSYTAYNYWVFRGKVRAEDSYH